MRRLFWPFVPLLVLALDCGRAPPQQIRDSYPGSPAAPAADSDALPTVEKPELPPVVSGSMTLNGEAYALTWGHGIAAPNRHVLRLITDYTVVPRIQVTLVVPDDFEPGQTATCAGPEPILFAAQWILPDAVAFFTKDPSCAVTLSHVATAAGEVYVGDFSGTLALDPRSVANVGFTTLKITAGRFVVTREF